MAENSYTKEEKNALPPSYQETLTRGQPPPANTAQPYPYQVPVNQYGQPGQTSQVHNVFITDHGYPGQTYPGQPQVVAVIAQPREIGNPSSTYLWLSIFVCLFCCWPIGIAAIVFSVRASNENSRGQFSAAQSSAKVALWCSISALIFGSLTVVTVIILIAVL